MVRDREEDDGKKEISDERLNRRWDRRDSDGDGGKEWLEEKEESEKLGEKNEDGERMKGQRN